MSGATGSDGRTAGAAAVQDGASVALSSSHGPLRDESASRGASSLSYEELQAKVQHLLGTEDWMTSADKVALALEVLRARQLELDLQQARSNIDSLITRAASSPRTLRAVIPSSAVRGMPVNVPIDLTKARLQLRPTANDPSAMFLSIEIFAFGNQESSSNASPPES